jgi:hypothetical protein
MAKRFVDRLGLFVLAALAGGTALGEGSAPVDEAELTQVLEAGEIPETAQAWDGPLLLAQAAAKPDAKPATPGAKPAPASPEDTQALDAIERLIRDNKPAEALKLLDGFVVSASTQLRHMYLRGVALINSGKSSEAVPLLEKVMQAAPRFAVGRFDLARAYFYTLNLPAARREFELLKTQSPPPGVGAILDSYLAAITAGERALARPSVSSARFSGYLEAGGGHDSNISAVTGDFTSGVQAAYGLPGFVPTGNSLRRSGGYGQLAGGLQMMYPLGNVAMLEAGANVYTRVYDHHAAFNSQSYDGYAGLGFLIGRTTYLRFFGSGQRYYQETAAATVPRITADREGAAYGAEWRMLLNATNTVSLLAQQSRQRFPTSIVNDYDQTQFAAAYTHLIPQLRNLSYTLSAFHNHDAAKNIIPGSVTGANYGKNVYGLRFGGQFDLVPNRVALFGSLGQSRRNDSSAFARATQIAYGKDDQTDITLGVNYRFDRSWSVRAQVGYTENRSNISLYSYRRTDAGVLLKWAF